MQDPWAEFRAPSAPRAPQSAFNDPIVAPAPPSERRADRAQQMQEVRTAQALEVERERLQLAKQAEARAQSAFENKDRPTPQTPEVLTERRARISTALKNLRDLERMTANTDMATGAVVGQESFRAGEDFVGLSRMFNQRANDVAGGIEMVQGDLINQVRNEMQMAGAPIGARGADTEKEASRLAASIANLAQTQDEGQFRVGLERAREYYLRRFVDAGGDPADLLQSSLEGGATVEELRALARGMGVGEDEIAALVGGNNPNGPTGGGDEPLRNFDPNDPTRGGLLPSPSQFAEGIAQGTGDIVQGIGDTVGMITDPFARTLADALGYDGSQMPSLGTAIREGVGLPQSEEGLGRSAREFAASGLVGGAAARGMSAVMAPGVAQNALNVLGRTPIRDTVAGAGAGAGAYAGEQIGGVPGQIVGTLAGGVAGYGAGSAAMRAAAPRAPNALAQASQRQGVDMLPADAGGPVARAVTTGTRASPVSVGPVVAAAERQQGQFGDAVRRTAASQGEVLDTQQAGETVRQGAQNFIEQSRARGTRLYERAEAQARGVKAIKPTQTVAAAREALMRLKENPAATPSEISGLEGFIQTIEGGVSIQGLRDARTKLSQGVYDGGLRSSSEQAMWKGILGNVADDIDKGLRSVGRADAANTFRTADRLWSERIEVIEKTLAPIIGKDGLKSGEQVLSAIEGMARGQGGGNMRLSRLLGTLSKEEAGNVRATLVDRLGRATPGAQDAQGETFSAATFLTNWNKMTPQARASMFPDKATRDSLGDLALIAEKSKRGQAMANTSNTGVAVTSANLVAGVTGAAVNLPATLVMGGSVYLTGKLMASPQFAKMLARTAKMPPEAANRAFTEQLGVLATRNPALQGDINALMRAVNDNGPRLAADQNNEQQ
jgi:hypothetical protein